jgi:predicted HTH domain antitoxin
MAGSLSLEIPNDTLASARLTLEEARLELAIALFANRRLSLGKAAELAQLPVMEFQMHLGVRHIGPNYDESDAHEDAAMLAGLHAS